MDLAAFAQVSASSCLLFQATSCRLANVTLVYQRPSNFEEVAINQVFVDESVRCTASFQFVSIGFHNEAGLPLTRRQPGIEFLRHNGLKSETEKLPAAYINMQREGRIIMA